MGIGYCEVLIAVGDWSCPLVFESSNDILAADELELGAGLADGSGFLVLPVLVPLVEGVPRGASLEFAGKGV